MAYSQLHTYQLLKSCYKEVISFCTVFCLMYIWKSSHSWDPLAFKHQLAWSLWWRYFPQRRGKKSSTHFKHIKWFFKHTCTHTHTPPPPPPPPPSGLWSGPVWAVCGNRCSFGFETLLFSVPFVGSCAFPLDLQTSQCFIISILRQNKVLANIFYFQKDIKIYWTVHINEMYLIVA